MSYDVVIGDFAGDYTFNLSALFHGHLKGDDGTTGLLCLHGRKGRECIPIIRRALSSIASEYCSTNDVTDFRKKYDPENMWGSTDGAILFLAQILAACAMNPRKKVSVWV